VVTVGLVPGAWNGAWCFERLVAELASRGIDAVAVDLPCDDAAAGFDRYVDVTAAALEGAEDVVLVGHSLGAHTIARAIGRLPVRQLVFLCGVIPPREGERTDDEPPMDEPGTFDALLHDDAGFVWWPGDGIAAVEAMYHDCAPEDSLRAVTRLRRQSTTPHRAIGDPVDIGDVPRTTIVCADDRAARAEWGRWAARERLGGAEVIELPGGHSPFLSRPAELADVLASIVSP
jgi:pimeloyl-ACP methyl ester carboxylesterase